MAITLQKGSLFIRLSTLIRSIRIANDVILSSVENRPGPRSVPIRQVQYDINLR